MCKSYISTFCFYTACVYSHFNDAIVSFSICNSAYRFRSGSSGTPIWLDDVGCTGTESRLLSCSNRGIGTHNCGHSEDVAIYCSSGNTLSRTDSTIENPL